MNVSSAALPPLPADSEYCVVARANDALGRRRRWFAFGVLAVGSLVLALPFAVAGAWLVLPYWALDIGVVAMAFAWYERHVTDWQRVVVVGDRVVVDETVGGKRQRREFSRYWLRVDVEQAGSGQAPRVYLRGGGASWEVGQALPGPERLAIARELRRVTGMH